MMFSHMVVKAKLSSPEHRQGKQVQLDAYKLEQSSNIRHNGLWVTKGRLWVRMNKIFGQDMDRAVALGVL